MKSVYWKGEAFKKRAEVLCQEMRESKYSKLGWLEKEK